MGSSERFIADRTLSIKPSGIRRFFDLLGDMKDVISLTVGQPDFETPWHIREAGIRSLEDGMTYYTSNSGLIEMRREIAAYQKRRFGLEYSPDDEMIVTVGGSEAIDLAIRAMCNCGDEFIVPEPCFVCYAPLITMAGGVPVPIRLKQENGFRLTANQLEAAVTDRTKGLILAYPNNPTGATMDRSALKAISDVIIKHDIAVISDEIYAELTYGDTHTSIAELDGMRERTVVIGGFSKAYAMTGWRLGYTLAPKDITKQMLKLHQYGIMCAPTVSQYAAIEALKNGDGDIEYMRECYDDRRRLLVSRLNAIGLPCFMPTGAFYAFPDISRFGLSSEEFCQRLLKEKQVALVPGSAFGDSGEGHVRISYAYSVQHIEAAVRLIKEFVDILEKE